MTIEDPVGCPDDAMAAALARVATLVSWKQLQLNPGNEPNPEKELNREKEQLRTKPKEEQKSNLTLSMPHQVFFVRTRRIRADIPLRDAVDAGGWRFLVRQDKEVKAAVQVWEDGATWRVSSVKTGSWATKTRDALLVAYGAGSDLPGVCAGPSYLWCRATWTAALWFRARNPVHDRVVPLPYVRKPFNPLKAYSAEEFMELVVGQVPAEPSYFYGYF